MITASAFVGTFLAGATFAVVALALIGLKIKGTGPNQKLRMGETVAFHSRPGGDDDMNEDEEF